MLYTYYWRYKTNPTPAEKSESATPGEIGAGWAATDR
jgi:hypothetical protein